MVTAPPQVPSSTLPELFRTFPDEDAAEQWLAAIRWPDRLRCPACGSERWYPVRTRNPRQMAMRYRCKDCKGYYSVRKGTLLGQNKTKLGTWVIEGVRFSCRWN